MPVLVALHGAGGQAADILEAYRADADANHFILLIPQSKGPTWDMIEDLKSRLAAAMNVQPHYGRDLKALDAALADLFARVSVGTAKPKCRSARSERPYLPFATTAHAIRSPLSPLGSVL